MTITVVGMCFELLRLSSLDLLGWRGDRVVILIGRSEACTASVGLGQHAVTFVTIGRKYLTVLIISATSMMLGLDPKAFKILASLVILFL